MLQSMKDVFCKRFNKFEHFIQDSILEQAKKAEQDYMFQFLKKIKL